MRERIDALAHVLRARGHDEQTVERLAMLLAMLDKLGDDATSRS